MIQSFAKGLEFLWVHEGYKTGASDPGGRTVWGISEKVYPAEVARMWDLPKEQSKQIAADIYLRDYWSKVDADNLPQGMDLFVFDTAVNMGVGRALDMAEGNENVFDFLVARIQAYMDIAKNSVYRPYLRGWIQRVLDLWQVVR